MLDVKFTALGMSGSGKTCFLAGFYYQMCSGTAESYTLRGDDTTHITLSNIYKKLSDSSRGQDRFPMGTDKKDNYKFTLERNYNPLATITWTDYRGGAIAERGADYAELVADIKQSHMVYIFVDSELLVKGTIEEKIKNVKLGCAAEINSLISDYVKTNEGQFPRVCFVVTKFDTLTNKVKRNAVEEVIKGAFSGLFQESLKAKVFIIPVSLGQYISIDGSTGEFNPMHVEVPILLGVEIANAKFIEVENKKRMEAILEDFEAILKDLRLPLSKDNVEEIDRLVVERLEKDWKRIEKLENQMATFKFGINKKRLSEEIAESKYNIRKYEEKIVKLGKKSENGKTELESLKICSDKIKTDIYLAVKFCWLGGERYYYDDRNDPNNKP